MADQYTRITCGGSPLSKDAPVVGLLFGQMIKGDHDDDDDDESGSRSILKIVDADDIPTDRSETATIQVSLHHAVFPLHDVVGWYRVGNSEQPTAEDLRLTQELKAHYHQAAAGVDAAAGDDANDDKPFFFSLLQVKHPNQDPHGKNSAMKLNNTSSAKEDNDNDDDELPLNLYEIQIHDQAAVLVGVENWSLETSEAERIAVERVVREQPQQDIKTTSNTSASKDGGVPEELPAQASPYVNYMTSVEYSLEAMQARIKIIMDYLERMGKGEIAPNPSLMRSIEGLILQLGPLQASMENSVRNNQPMNENDAHLFSHLAAVAKVVQSVHSYTDKFRTLHENRPTGGREGRRGY
jgi:COP9 signalosome complex subunit 6